MIYVFAGHVADKSDKDYDPGAVSNGYTEAELTKELRELIVREFIDMGMKSGVDYLTDNDGYSLKEIIAKTDSLEHDVIFDIHWNAASPAATGCEVFVPERATSEERNIATLMVKKTSDLLGIKNRGVKDETASARKRLAIMRPAGINLLIEVCFITNPSDMKSYQEKKFKLASLLVQILKDAETLIK